MHDVPTVLHHPTTDDTPTTRLWRIIDHSPAWPMIDRDPPPHAEAVSPQHRSTSTDNLAQPLNGLRRL